MIIISPKDGFNADVSNCQVFELELLDELDSIINYFLKSDSSSFILTANNPGILWDKFVGFFKNIKAAGGIVKKEDSVLFIYRLKKWDLPKGKIEVGETPEQAAVREVEEECGITGLKIQSKLPSTWHIYKSPYKENKGEWILKETFWFEMFYSGNTDPTPQTEEDIEKAVWLKNDNLQPVLDNTYSSLKEIITFISDF